MQTSTSESPSSTLETAEAQFTAAAVNDCGEHKESPSSPTESHSTRLPQRATSHPMSVSTLSASAEVEKVRERRNWLIYQLYARQEYLNCLSVIETQLRESEGVCEFALYVKGLLCRRNGNLTESFNLFQTATLINPQNPANQKQLAQSLFLLGQHRAAIDAFRDTSNLLLLNGAGEDWELEYSIGMCYMHLKRYDDAESAFLKSASIQWHECSLLQLARVLALQGEHARAISILDGAIQMSSESPELLTALGLLYLKTGQNAKAFDLIGRCLTVDPGNPTAVMAAASVMQDNGDYAVALNKYRIAVVKRPHSAQLWSNIGMSFFASENTHAAIACLRKAVSLAPFDWRIAYNLGIVFLHLKQCASAFHYLSASRYLHGNYAPVYMYLGVCLSLMNDVENACAAYMKALSLDPDPLIRLNYVITLLNSGQTGEASRQFARFVPLWLELGDATREAMGKETARAVENLAAHFCASDGNTSNDGTGNDLHNHRSSITGSSGGKTSPFSPLEHAMGSPSQHVTKEWRSSPEEREEEELLMVQAERENQSTMEVPKNESFQRKLQI